jgi:hypothetical protein
VRVQLRCVVVSAQDRLYEGLRGARGTQPAAGVLGPGPVVPPWRERTVADRTVAERMGEFNERAFTVSVWTITVA